MDSFQFLFLYQFLFQFQVVFLVQVSVLFRVSVLFQVSFLFQFQFQVTFLFLFRFQCWFLYRYRDPMVYQEEFLLHHYRGIHPQYKQYQVHIFLQNLFPQIIYIIYIHLYITNCSNPPRFKPLIVYLTTSNLHPKQVIT